MSKKKRIEFIDIAKGIAIFLVIWGHTATNEELLSAACPLLPKVLYSFHMPLFFFLAGLSMSTDPLKTWAEWKAFLKKSILTIAIPYFIWALIYCTFNYSNVALIFYGSWKNLGTVASLTSLWFLPALFVAKILTELMISFTKRKAWPFITLIMLVIGLLLPALPNGYPWCSDVAFVAAACISFAILLKKPLIQLSVQKIRFLTLLLCASIAVYIGSVLFDGAGFPIVMMCQNSYGTGIGWILRALSGGFAVILISMIFRQLAETILSDRATKPLIYIGQYTMGIFILHKPFMQQVFIPLLTDISAGTLSTWLIRLISALVVMLLCLPVCNIIIHYIPELIGIFSKDKIKLKESR